MIHESIRLRSGQVNTNFRNSIHNFVLEQFFLLALRFFLGVPQQIIPQRLDVSSHSIRAGQGGGRLFRAGRKRAVLRYVLRLLACGVYFLVNMRTF
jgi:hypothetical protein